MDTSTDNIELLISKILREVPLMGYIFSNLKRRKTNRIPTMGVTPDNELLYNADFVKAISEDIEGAKYVLFHEWLHLAQEHIPRAEDMTEIKYGKCVKDYMKSGDDPAYMPKLNIAMDVAINQLCDMRFKRPPVEVIELYHHDTTFAKFCKIEDPSTIEAKRDWEYYFSLIPDDVMENMEAEGSGQGSPTNDHSEHFGEGGSTNKVKREEMRNMLRKSAELQKEHEVKSGCSPDNSLFEIIPDICSVTINDRSLWESLATSGFGTRRTNMKTTTMRRPSRRDEKNPFGRTRIKAASHNVVIIDTSGSCMNDIPMFLGVIERACKRYQTTVDLLFTTTQVYSVYEKQRTLKMENYEIHSGGTDLTRAQQYIMEKGYSRDTSVVVLTDGETPWLDANDGWGYDTKMIYTNYHTKLENVKKFAVLPESL
jgi:predicted metal-dependent peptidase